MPQMSSPTFQPFSHINLAPATDQSVQLPQQQPAVFGAYGPFPTGPSLRPSSVSQENKRPVTINTLWPDLTEQAKAVENAKVQNDRLQSQVALPRPKRGRRGLGRAWVPLDLHDSGDDNISLPDEQQRTTPFDVHAKIFEPTPSRNSVERNATTGVCFDDIFASAGGDFRPPREASKPTGLNAYQVTADTRPLTVAASYDDGQLCDVFGEHLPGIEFCAANPGIKHGQVQFCKHPNGDVSAQQWSAIQPQPYWLNIGQYSNIRKRIEGQMASERLRGETELQSLQQNTLPYFRAVGLQRQAISMGLPFGPREIQACMHSLRYIREQTLSATPPTAATSTPPRGPRAGMLGKLRTLAAQADRSSAHRAAHHADKHADNLFDLSQNMARPTTTISTQQTLSGGAMPSYSTRQSNQSSNRQAEQYRNSLAGLTFGSLPSLTRQSSDASCGAPDSRPANTSQSTMFPNHAHLSVSDSQLSTLSSEDEDLANESKYAFTDVIAAIKETAAEQTRGNEYQQYTLANQILPTPERKTYAQRSDHDMAEESLDKYSTPQSNRITYKDFLQKVGDSASARGQGANAAARTVLHDPLRSRSVNASSDSSLDVSTFAKGLTRDPTVLQHHRRPPPGLPFPPEGCKDLSISSPEPGWKDRPVEVVNVNAPQMSHKELAMYSKPTPSARNSPFLGDSPPPQQQDTKQQTYDKELSDWFHGGKKVERQEEFFKRICAAHRSSPATPRRPSNLGPIGPHSSASSTKTAGGEQDNNHTFNKTTTRLLIPVLENLASYVEGPIEKRHGFGARFVRPPEWCIDKSPNGNNSFFGDEWGQPPQRIGRDQRYRQLNESDYGSFDSSPVRRNSGGVPLNRSPVAVRSPARAAVDGRFRYAAGRNY